MTTDVTGWRRCSRCGRQDDRSPHPGDYSSVDAMPDEPDESGRVLLEGAPWAQIEELYVCSG